MDMPTSALTGITLKDMFDAGLHFGHQTKRWNPKMRDYIFDKRNGIHIIDLHHGFFSHHRDSFHRILQGLHGQILRIETMEVKGLRRAVDQLLPGLIQIMLLQEALRAVEQIQLPQLLRTMAGRRVAPATQWSDRPGRP